MQIKNLLKDDGAVSPVIGVILMVAITVILAAVIGAFVLNLGGSQNAAPQASFTCDGTALNHDGGDAIQETEVTVGNKTTDDGEYTAGDEISSDFVGTELVWENPDGSDTQILREEDC